MVFTLLSNFTSVDVVKECQRYFASEMPRAVSKETSWQVCVQIQLYGKWFLQTLVFYLTFYAPADYAQWRLICFHFVLLSRCLSHSPAPTWTRPQGGQVHYTHAAVEAIVCPRAVLMSLVVFCSNLFKCFINRMVLFPMILSDLEWLSEIFSDTKRRAVSLRQPSFMLPSLRTGRSCRDVVGRALAGGCHWSRRRLTADGLAGLSVADRRTGSAPPPPPSTDLIGEMPRPAVRRCQAGSQARLGGSSKNRY